MDLGIIPAMKNSLPYLILPVIIGAAIFLAVMTDAKKAYVNLYDPQLKHQQIPCLSLSIFPPDSTLENTLKKRYDFRTDCPWKLDVKTKENIHCNSNQNSGKKALTAFPNSFLRMEIRKGFALKYSYYVDLTESANPDDILEGFDRLSNDLNIK